MHPEERERLSRLMEVSEVINFYLLNQDFNIHTGGLDKFPVDWVEIEIICMKKMEEELTTIGIEFVHNDPSWYTDRYRNETAIFLWDIFQPTHFYDILR